MSDINLFEGIDQLSASEIQMDLVAADLTLILKHSGLNRSQLADKLGCKKSRVTRILSGDDNLTLKTITSVAEVLGYAYDVVFYNKNYAKPKQPWTIDREHRIKLKNTEQMSYFHEFQRKLKGNNATTISSDVYVSTYIEVNRTRTDDGFWSTAIKRPQLIEHDAIDYEICEDI